MNLKIMILFISTIFMGFSLEKKGCLKKYDLKLNPVSQKKGLKAELSKLYNELKKNAIDKKPELTMLLEEYDNRNLIELQKEYESYKDKVDEKSYNIKEVISFYSYTKFENKDIINDFIICSFLNSNKVPLLLPIYLKSNATFYFENNTEWLCDTYIKIINYLIISVIKYYTDINFNVPNNNPNVSYYTQIISMTILSLQEIKKQLKLEDYLLKKIDNQIIEYLQLLQFNPLGNKFTKLEEVESSFFSLNGNQSFSIEEIKYYKDKMLEKITKNTEYEIKLRK